MNNLSNAKSPYLLQHKDNPVHWHEWGEAAFQKARDEDKPIFLSVGYSTCHWCHVMERESFENEAVAQIMNEGFVNIKVDREERPDIDRVYMTFVQATTGSGGWPMSVFLTPDLKPFYGGTYFPPDDRYGRPGFATLLRGLSSAWREDRDNVLQTAQETMRVLASYADSESDANTRVDWEKLFANCARSFASSYDARYGGFGDAPKFPRPVTHDFLHRYALQTRDEKALQMSRHTLGAMSDGGMHDQLGGGFHRYSVDAQWIVSHFEKMLYDQAQLAISYLEMFQMTREEYFAVTAQNIFDYVLRDMTHEAGGFFSAEDADSFPPPSVASTRNAAPDENATTEKETREGAAASTRSDAQNEISESADTPRDVETRDNEKSKSSAAKERENAANENAAATSENATAENAAASTRDEPQSECVDAERETAPHAHKEEGAFYVWTTRELETVLGAENAALFGYFYGAEPQGNAPPQGDPHGEFRGKNILYLARDLDETARRFKVSPQEALRVLATSRAQLFAAREQRPRPHRDEKIIAAWNGLMISAFARAAQALDEPRYAAASTRALDFVKRELWDEKTGKLQRHFQGEAAGVAAFSDDYAALARAAIDVFETTFDFAHLRFAEELLDSLHRDFHDAENGGYFIAQPDESVLLRMKEDYDGAEPSANSLAAEALLRLSRLLERDDLRTRATELLNVFGRRVAKFPHAMPALLGAALHARSAPLHIVIVGETESDNTRDLLRVVHGLFLPFKTLIVLTENNRAELEKRLPFVADMKQIENRATAYVCRDFACRQLVATQQELLDELQGALAESE